MTKKVRIENADTSSYQVVVQTWNRGKGAGPDTMVKEEILSYPTALIDAWIWQEQYLVIKEA